MGVRPRDHGCQQEYRDGDAAESVDDLQEDWPEAWIKPLGVVRDDTEAGYQECQDDADQSKHRVRRGEMVSVVGHLVHHDDDQTDQDQGQACCVRHPVHRHPVRPGDLGTKVRLARDAENCLRDEKANSEAHADGMPREEVVVSKSQGEDVNHRCQ